MTSRSVIFCTRSEFARPNHHARLRSIERQHEKRLAIAGKPKAFALTYGEKDNAIVTAEHAPGLINDVACPHRVRLQFFNDVRITAIGDETNVLAIRLLGIDKAKLSGNGAHMRLSIPPRGKLR